MYTKNYVDKIIKNFDKKELLRITNKLKNDISFFEKVLETKNIDLMLYNEIANYMNDMRGQHHYRIPYRYTINITNKIISQTYQYEKYYILEKTDGTKLLAQSFYSKIFDINGIKYGKKMLILDEKLNNLLKKKTEINDNSYYYDGSFVEKNYFKSITPASSLYTEEEILNFKNLLKDKTTRTMLKGLINEV